MITDFNVKAIAKLEKLGIIRTSKPDEIDRLKKMGMIDKRLRCQ